MQKKYNISWSRLQKIWDANPVRITKEPQENINRKIEGIVPQESIIQQEPIPQHREIVVEDFYARLGRIEAKMERQTELMQNILDSLDAVSDIESNTQSILEKENKESRTLQDLHVGTSVQEYTDFTKTLVYCAITGFAVWQMLCKAWKHIDKRTSPVSTMSTIPVPTKPRRPSLFKKEPDVFDF